MIRLSLLTITLCSLLVGNITGCQETNTTAHQGAEMTTGNLQTVTPEEAKALLDQQPEVVLLDVRTPEEFAEGHLSKAINLDYNAPDFAKQVKQLDPDQTYLVYCAVGGRSNKASTLMAELGFHDIYNAKVGFKDLKAAGIPAE
jgi:phage shock protein E